jgi:hypothetical protein
MIGLNWTQYRLEPRKKLSVPETNCAGG